MGNVRRLTAVVLVLAVAAACEGDDEDADPSREELVNALVDGGLEPVDARCWIGEVYEHLSLEDKRAIQSANSSYEEYANPERVRDAGNQCID